MSRPVPGREGQGAGALKGPRHASHAGISLRARNFRSWWVQWPCIRSPFFSCIPAPNTACWASFPFKHIPRSFLEVSQGTGSHADHAANPAVPEPPHMCWPRGRHSLQSLLRVWIPSQIPAKRARPIVSGSKEESRTPRVQRVRLLRKPASEMRGCSATWRESEEPQRIGPG